MFSFGCLTHSQSFFKHLIFNVFDEQGSIALTHNGIVPLHDQHAHSNNTRFSSHRCRVQRKMALFLTSQVRYHDQQPNTMPLISQQILFFLPRKYYKVTSTYHAVPSPKHYHTHEKSNIQKLKIQSYHPRASLSAIQSTFSDTSVSADHSSIDPRLATTMPGTRASSAQVTAKVNQVVTGTGPQLSEHQQAVALLESRRRAIEEARPFTERQAALVEARQQSPDVEYLFSRPLTGASEEQNSTPILVVDTSDSGEAMEDADVEMTSQDDGNLEITTEKDDNNATSSAGEASSAITDSDIARIPAPTLAPRPPVSEGGASDSELTEILDSGLTPPTTPVTQGGQSIQPAGLSEQRQRLALLARGEEPLHERMERARQQHEQEIAESWELEYAMSDPIEEAPESDDDDDYEDGSD